MQMLMKCLYSNLGVLMYTRNLSWGPPIARLYFLLHGFIGLALYKGLHAAEARPIQKGGYRAVHVGVKTCRSRVGFPNYASKDRM